MSKTIALRSVLLLVFLSSLVPARSPKFLIIEKHREEPFFYDDNNELEAVRQGPWKLRLPNLKKIRNWSDLDRGSKEAELHQLDLDPGESNNLAAREPEVVSRLMKMARDVRPD